jgi:hypothetical protein
MNGYELSIIILTAVTAVTGIILVWQGWQDRRKPRS